MQPTEQRANQPRSATGPGAGPRATLGQTPAAVSQGGCRWERPLQRGGARGELAPTPQLPTPHLSPGKAGRRGVPGPPAQTTAAQAQGPRAPCL